MRAECTIVVGSSSIVDCGAHSRKHPFLNSPRKIPDKKAAIVQTTYRYSGTPRELQMDKYSV